MKYKRLNQSNFEDCKKIFDDIFDFEPYLQWKKDFNLTGDFESEWKSMLKYGRIYGLFNQDKLIAFCSWIYFSMDLYITICNLTVDKKLQRQRFGMKILKYTINQVKKRNKKIIAQTNEIEFFKKSGFHIVTDFDDDKLQPYRYIVGYEK